MTTTQERLHLIASGRVQGVGFRYHTQAKASSLGLTGWVKNLPDGAVEIVAEGPKSALEKLLEWTHHGPPAASVTEVRARWFPALGEMSDFRIQKN